MLQGRQIDVTSSRFRKMMAETSTKSMHSMARNRGNPYATNAGQMYNSSVFN